MSKDPAVLFYPDNFMTGTMFFTDDQVGKYIRALCAQQLHGHLAKEQIDSIVKNDIVVMEKFKVDRDDKYYNERMQKEMEKRSSYCDSRRSNLYKSKSKQHRHMTNHMREHMGNGNGNGNEDRNGIEIPPTLEAIQAYCTERKNSVDPNQFFDFYTSKNWMIGKNKMKDWQAAVRTWEKRSGEQLAQPRYGRQEVSTADLKAQAERLLHGGLK